MEARTLDHHFVFFPDPSLKYWTFHFLSLLRLFYRSNLDSQLSIFLELLKFTFTFHFPPSPSQLHKLMFIKDWFLTFFLLFAIITSAALGLGVNAQLPHLIICIPHPHPHPPSALLWLLLLYGSLPWWSTIPAYTLHGLVDFHKEQRAFIPGILCMFLLPNNAVKLKPFWTCQPQKNKLLRVKLPVASEKETRNTQQTRFVY